MTDNVLMGALNPTHSLTHSLFVSELKFGEKSCGICCMSYTEADDVEDSDDSVMDTVPSSVTIAKNLGVQAPHIQWQKASFFAANYDGDDDAYSGYGRQIGKLLAVLLEISSTGRD